MLVLASRFLTYKHFWFSPILFLCLCSHFWIKETLLLNVVKFESAERMWGVTNISFSDLTRGFTVSQERGV